MKKIVTVFVILLMVCGCNKETTIEEKEEIVFVDSNETIDFDSFLDDVNKNNEERCYLEFDEDEYKSYLKISDEQRKLFTKSEINKLKKNTGNNQSVSKQDAIDDVDVLFKLIKHSYAPYHYLGGDEFFDSLKQEILNNINKDSYDKKELLDILFNTMNKVVDCHFRIENQSLGRLSIDSVEYYYSPLYTFSKDDNGFYLNDDKGVKYYYVGCKNNAQASIEATLLQNGSFKYCLTLLINSNYVNRNDVLLLKKEDGEEVQVEFKWKIFDEAYRDNDVFYKWTDDVLYVKVGTFGFNNNSKEYKAYVEAGKLAKDARAVILDYRGNGGGGHSSTERFISNLTKDKAGLSYRMNAKVSLINSVFDGRYYQTGYYKPNYCHNDIPIYVLIDRNSASATEVSIDLLRSVENVIVVGSNSDGALISGGDHEVFLPNSGIKVEIPTDFELRRDGHMPEGRGLYPDIWCNPKDSLTAVYKHLGFENSPFEKQDISIQVYETKVTDGQNIGDVNNADILTVKLKDKPLVDGFTISFDEEDITYTLNGSDLTINVPKEIKKAVMTLTYKDLDYHFIYDIEALDIPYSDISMMVEETEVFMGQNMGNVNDVQNIIVLYKGEPLKGDYQVEFDQAGIEYKTDGSKLTINIPDSISKTTMTIKYKDDVDFYCYYDGSSFKKWLQDLYIQVNDVAVYEGQIIGNVNDAGTLYVKYKGLPIEGEYFISFDSNEIEYRIDGSKLTIKVPQNIKEATMTLTYEGRPYEFYYERFEESNEEITSKISIQVHENEVFDGQFIGDVNNAGALQVKFDGKPINDKYSVSFDVKDVNYTIDGSNLTIKLPDSVNKTEMTLKHNDRDYHFTVFRGMPN